MTSLSAVLRQAGQADELPDRRGPAAPDLTEFADHGDAAKARDAFFRAEAVPRGTVRQTILASWSRSLDHALRPGEIDLGHEADVDPRSFLATVAGPIMDDVTDALGNEPISVILCDDSGVVLSRRTGDRELERHLDRVWLTPGFSYSEEHVGTNGIGTALECRGPVQVFGAEHWVEQLDTLACAGTPIHHPVTGKVVGVLDLTCERVDANALMMTAATMIAKRVESAMLAQAGRREVALLQNYLAAAQRHRGPVLAVGADVLMINEAGRTQLGAADQALLVASATDVLTKGRRATLTVHLPSGVTARVHCRPTGTGGLPEGVLLVNVSQDVSTGVPVTSHAPAARPLEVGSGALWTICRRAVDRHFVAGEWLALVGEPGSGRRTLALATHRARTPAAHLRQMAASEDGPHWVDQVAEELAEEGGTLILSDVDRLPAQTLEQLADLLSPNRESTDPGRPWVVVTLSDASQPTANPALERLLECFPRTVDVPPLRMHPEDVPDLVRHFLSRGAHGGEVSCSAAALRVLTRNRWPGNVEQLRQVVRQAVMKRRAGVIEVSDLPTELLSTARRVLTPLEAIECDAIVKALMETKGNKAEAAALLGMSRATIYRKVREYGISVP